MENASKALIIAGAILLSILIIGLGMFIYRQAAGVMNNTGLDELAVDKHNEGFLQYQGTKVSGTQVKALVKKIEANNRTNSDDESLQISATLDGTVLIGTGSNFKSSGTASSSIKSGYTYSVDFTYDTGSNYVNACTITQNK